MIENEIAVETDDGRMRVFLVHPDSRGPFPVALLYMDGVGYREQVKANARRFAADGYFCVAPDLFYRFGDDVTFDFSQMGDPGFRERVISLIGGLKPQMVAADTQALLAAVANDPAAAAGPKVCVGYCMGARMALHVAGALPDEFVAAAGIHPGALVRGDVERLSGTSHGFAMADLPVYDERAAEHHFERTLELWRRNLSQETVQA